MESNLKSPSIRPRLHLLKVLALVCFALGVVAPGASAFGVKSFEAKFEADSTGFPALQAGSHPYLAGAKINFETEERDGKRNTAGDVRNIDIELPAGLIGDPSAVSTCEPTNIVRRECPADSQIGRVSLDLGSVGSRESNLYNLTPPPGVAAEFGFDVVGVVPVLFTADVRPGSPGGEGPGIDLHFENLAQTVPIYSASLEFFGDPSGTPGRRPFVTMPTQCGRHLEIRAHLTSWQGQSATASTLVPGQGGAPVTVTGCDQVPFEPRFAAGLDTSATDSPSGLTVDIKTPQSSNPLGLASANLRSTDVSLPPGVSVNPAAADGLAACSIAQFDQFGKSPSTCPENSKIGSVQIDTPLIPDPLVGGVYLARQGENPFGSLIALYLIAEADGIRVKLPGNVGANPLTGQLTASFDETPQLPFEELKLHFFDGPRAALATPIVCGTGPVGAALTPWSVETPASLSSSLTVGAGVGGGACPSAPGARPFGLGLEVGTVSPAAALHSPFALKVSRPDGNQELSRIDATLPEGLLATLKGVPQCAAADAAAGTCGAASQVGSLVVGAGAGADPYSVEGGRAYLTGPYGGAPLGLDFVVPAVAGPLDLGTVNVRAALFVDPETTQVTVKSSPLPKILQGIPLRLRSVAIGVDRPGFIVNPTSCDPTQVGSQVTSTEGATANLTDRFQAAGCGALAFAPKLTVALKGGTRRNGHPALTAVLTQAAGQANISRVSVTLPHSEFLEQAHIRTVCTRVQFAADACPAGSIYGYAEALTPLLGGPLRGPVYLRSSSHTLPDLVAQLKGPASEPIEIDLSGRIDSARGALRTTFEGIPDAPISKFTLRLRGGKKSLIVNSVDLCRDPGKVTVKTTGQNGALHDLAAPLRAKCGRDAQRARRPKK